MEETLMNLLIFDHKKDEIIYYEIMAARFGVKLDDQKIRIKKAILPNGKFVQIEIDTEERKEIKSDLIKIDSLERFTVIFLYNETKRTNEILLSDVADGLLNIWSDITKIRKEEKEDG